MGITAPRSSVIPAFVALVGAAHRFLRLRSSHRLLRWLCRRSRRCHRKCISGAVCGELEAATGCWGRSGVASLVDAVTPRGIAVCGELDGDAAPCRLFGALIADEAGDTIVESVVLGLRGHRRND